MVADNSLYQERVDSFFEIVDGTCQDEFKDQIIPALRRRFDKPPTDTFNKVLGVSLTGPEARRILYTPSAADMAIYAQLLEGDPDHSKDLSDNSANRAQVVALTHLYLVHGRVWMCLRPFIEAGGLRRLVDLLSHPNPLLGSQALHLLITATHPDMYGWNHPPGFAQPRSAAGTAIGSAVQNEGSSGEAVQLQQQEEEEEEEQQQSAEAPQSSGTEAAQQQQQQQEKPIRVQQQQQQQPTAGSKGDGSLIVETPQQQQQQQQQHPSQGPDGNLWQQLASLHNSQLLPSLLRLSPDVWPGSGPQAIQLMVFYLNWLRSWWSKDGTLQLSSTVLDGLRAWSTRSDATDLERRLASQLLEDFGRAGPAAAAGSSSSSSGGIELELDMDLHVVADKTQVNSSPGSEAARLKAAGNDAFKARDWATAIKLYSAALDVPVPAAALLDEAPRRAIYHTNRAAAYLERVWELQAAAAGSSTGSSSWVEVGGVLDGVVLGGSDESVMKQLDAAVMDCRAALGLVPTHVKAHYRLATALRARGDLAAAAVAAAAARDHAMSAADKAAAAKLAAVIAQQQQQQEGDKPIELTAKKPSSNTAAAAAAAENGWESQPPAVDGTVGKAGGSSSNAPPAAAATAVDQLLQEFTAALSAAAKPAPVTFSGAKQSGEEEKSQGLRELQIPIGSHGAKTAARQRQQQQQHYGEGLGGSKEKQSAPCKVLIEVLAGAEDSNVVTAADGSSSSSDSGAAVRFAATELKQQQQCHNLDELVEVLD